MYVRNRKVRSRGSGRTFRKRPYRRYPYIQYPGRECNWNQVRPTRKNGTCDIICTPPFRTLVPIHVVPGHFGSCPPASPAQDHSTNINRLCPPPRQNRRIPKNITYFGHLRRSVRDGRMPALNTIRQLCRTRTSSKWKHLVLTCCRRMCNENFSFSGTVFTVFMIVEPRTARKSYIHIAHRHGDNIENL